MDKSVKHIVERCQQGDREAFGLLYTAAYDRLRSVCRRYVTDESTVDDLLHDSFLLIFSKINSLKDASKAEAWMQKVTQNLSLMYLEHHKQQPTVSLDELNEPLTETAPATMAITYDEIMNLVDALPNSYRQVFRLSVLDGLSHQEIAALLNIEPHTSSAHLVKAKKKLRQSLALLLLALLPLFLPLGLWYALRQPTEPPVSPAANKPTASAKPVSEQKDDEPPVVEKNLQTSDKTKNQQPAASTAPAGSPGGNTAQLRQQPGAKSEDQDSVKTPQKQQHPTDKAPMPPAPPTTPALPTITPPHYRGWTLAIAYSGLNNRQSFNLPYGEYDMNDSQLDTITHHRMPLTVGLSVNKMLGNRLSLGTGLQYTQLYSETQAGNTYTWEQSQQRVRYLGIPLRLSWHPVRTRHWSVYGTAQAMLELPLHSTLQKATYVNGLQVETDKLRLSPSAQWSVGVGAGLEYRLTPVIGIFAEPSLQYFFKTVDALDTWRTAHPATFSVPLGIRITWE